MSSVSPALVSLLKRKPDSSLINLPLLPPISSKLENVHILKQESRSAVALAELRMWLQRHTNPRIFTDTMMLREAQFSTAIESGQIGLERIMEAMAVQTQKPDRSIANVLNCLNALNYGWDVLLQNKGVSIKDILRIAIILQGNEQFNEEPEATFNTQNDYIRLLQNLTNYFNDRTADVSPLIRLCVQHYQFEIIHPFYLENGRTGRVLNLLFLSLHHLLPHPVLSLSEYILQNKIEYYHLHQQVREQNEWMGWIRFLLRGIERTAQKTLTYLNEIQGHYETIANSVQAQAPSISAKPLIDLIFQRPYCKIEYVKDHKIAQRKAAGKYLHVLNELDILKKKKVGKENIFIHQSLIDKLQA